MAEYANIIVDIYQGKLDKTFQYRVPERLKSTIAVGILVSVPFGSRKMQGYVIELTDVCEYEEDKIKEILAVVKDGVRIESQMIALAGWMRENYGGTMNHALKTVLPVKEKKKAKETFEFVIKTAGKHCLLGEQIDNNTLKPNWVLGLGWSHAMFIIVLEKMLKNS